MSDVFISYARSTASQARAVAEALRSLGYDVWLDDELPAHRAYTHVIEEQLTAAKAVLVIWSAEAARSEWVLSEANRARQERKLVQLTIDETRLPMPFDQTQCADLVGWTGDVAALGWRKVVSSIAELTGAASFAPPSHVAGRRFSIRYRRSAWAAAAIAVIALLGVAWWVGLGAFHALPPPTEARVAILPFESLGGGQQAISFAAGLTDEILSVLSVNQVQAISRADSVSMRGANGSEALGRLRVGLLLDGTVQTDRQVVRVRVHLDDAHERVSLWSAEFEGASNDTEALQAEVAARASDMTKWAVIGRSAAGGQIDTATLAAFIQGSDQLSNGGARAIPILRQVVAHSPNFAPGHSHLAMALAGSTNDATAGERGPMLDEARREARRALALDPKTGEAYLALQVMAPLGAWGEREGFLLKGLGVDPEFPYLSFLYSQLLGQVGRSGEALAMARRAAALNPLFVYANGNLASRLAIVGQVERGRSAIERTTRLWPQDPVAGAQRFYMAALSGSPSEARSLLNGPGAGPIPTTAAVVRVWDAVLRVREARSSSGAASAARSVVAAAEAGQFDRRDAVLALALLGDVDNALLEAERFYTPPRMAEPSGRALPLDTTILFHPATQSLRRDRRFMVLADKLGLVAYWRKSGRWPDFCNEPGLPYNCRIEAVSLTHG